MGWAVGLLGRAAGSEDLQGVPGSEVRPGSTFFLLSPAAVSVAIVAAEKPLDFGYYGSITLATEQRPKLGKAQAGPIADSDEE